MCIYAIQVKQNITLVFILFGWEYSTFNQLPALTTLLSLVMSLYFSCFEHWRFLTKPEVGFGWGGVGWRGFNKLVWEIHELNCFLRKVITQRLNNWHCTGKGSFVKRQKPGIIQVHFLQSSIIHIIVDSTELPIPQ